MTGANSEALTRRNLLAALPVAGAAVAIPPLALAEEEDPILPLYRQWVAARREWYRYADLPDNGNWDMPESQVASDQEDAAFAAMIELTPSSMAGIAALMHVLWDLEGPVVASDSEEYLEHAGRPNCKLMLAIWRAASGQRGLPPNEKMEIIA